MELYIMVLPISGADCDRECSGRRLKDPCTRRILHVSEGGGRTPAIRSAGVITEIPAVPTEVLHVNHAPGHVRRNVQEAQTPDETAPGFEMSLEVLVPLAVIPHLALGLGPCTQRTPLPQAELGKVLHPLEESVAPVPEPPEPGCVIVLHKPAPITRAITSRESTRQSTVMIIECLAGVPGLRRDRRIRRHCNMRRLHLAVGVKLADPGMQACCKEP